MKRLIPVLVLTFLLCGCSPEAEMAMDFSSGTENTEVVAQFSQPTTTLQVPVYIYTPQEILSDTMPELSPAAVLQKLHHWEVLPPDIALLEFTQESDTLALDFNDALRIHLDSLGTKERATVLQCLVNTFLDAYNAQALTVTVDGAPLVCGRTLYDHPMTYDPDYLN